MRIAVSCFLANQSDLRFPLETALESYLEADEVFLFSGDPATGEAWARAVAACTAPGLVQIYDLPRAIERPQDICAAKNACIDLVAARTGWDAVLIVDPDVVLVPRWKHALADIAGKRAPSPFRLHIQNVIAFINVGLMPFGTILMPRGFPGRLVWDGSYFSPQDPAMPGYPLALHLGYLSLTAVRHHFVRNKRVWAEFIGEGGVGLLERYLTLDERAFAAEVLTDLRDARRPNVHMLNYGTRGRRLEIITESEERGPGRPLGSWIDEVVEHLGMKRELDVVRDVIRMIGRTPAL